MFTGIVEEIGKIKNVLKSANGAFLTVECNRILDDVKLGDSIAINGVCQTVVKLDSAGFCVDVSQETLAVTTFSSIKSCDSVNLERALNLQTRLGGHIVSGHIDGLAKIRNIKKSSDFYTIEFEVDKNLVKYIVKKGSVAINGISLTVADINSNIFSVAVIPHTFENTILKSVRIGDFVNLETDIMAKYVEKILLKGNNSGVDENFLKENGFC